MKSMTKMNIGAIISGVSTGITAITSLGFGRLDLIPYELIPIVGGFGVLVCYSFATIGEDMADARRAFYEYKTKSEGSQS